MVLPGHLAGGFLTASAILSATNPAFTTTQNAVLLAIGTIFGDGPDIDLFWYSFKHLVLKSRENDNHREYVSHAPLVWLILSLVIVGIGALAGSLFTQYIGWMVLAGSWTHLILDSIEFGVMWLWPFTKKRFALRHPEDFMNMEAEGEKGTLAYHWNFVTKIYPKFWTAYAEIAITAIGLIVFFKML